LALHDAGIMREQPYAANGLGHYADNNKRYGRFLAEAGIFGRFKNDSETY